MITCPDCGQTTADETRFCERCGRGLQDVPVKTALAPLAIGQELDHRFKIVELLSQSSEENRYRASAPDNSATFFVLRERLAPLQPAGEVLGETGETGAAQAPPVDAIDPRAPTRDLSLAAARQPPAAEAAPPEPTAPAQAVSEVILTDAAEASADSLPSAAENHAAAGADTPAAAESGAPAPDQGNAAPDGASAAPQALDGTVPADAGQTPAARGDLGEVFERVLALAHSLSHPAFYSPIEGFVAEDRTYLVYRDERLAPFSRGQRAAKLTEPAAVAVGVQLCQALAYVHKRGLRLNDLCPSAMAYGADGRIKLIGLDYISNDNELQAAPILNDGYTAPEIYRGKGVDKRADIFSVGCVLYSCLTGERIDSETWREEAGPIRFYPPHAISPGLEQIVRRALQFRPAERWLNVDVLKEAMLKQTAHVEIRSGGLTDVGMVREHNEDSILSLEYSRDSQIGAGEHYLYVVSDGMGGAAAGETASAIAVETIRDYVEQGLAKGESSLAEMLQQALEEANRRIIERQSGDPELRGMGATAVSVLIRPPEAALAWVGDSRIYLVDRGSLRQLTKDHSLVQRLVEIGQISADEARHHEHKNVITRSLGARGSGPAGAEVLALRLKRGDRLMLCSDGLNAHVDDREIAEILGRQEDPKAASLELVVAANAGGGTDNISVIVVDAK